MRIFVNYPPFKSFTSFSKMTIFSNFFSCTQKKENAKKDKDILIDSLKLSVLVLTALMIVFSAFTASTSPIRLKSPLEMLNKNSQIAQPQKHMAYIEKRFNNINNAWLKISDNLQQGIHKIQQRMMPQFNVIRQTFKKNSVQQIIKQLTSNDITHKKIQEYVSMINMVKKYKFNDIKKLKFMTFIIEHKLSKLFQNANNRIKDIMNNVIKETDQMNFLNFNVEQLTRDRSLFLQISKNLNFQKIQELSISSESFKQQAQAPFEPEPTDYILIEDDSEEQQRQIQENLHNLVHTYSLESGIKQKSMLDGQHFENIQKANSQSNQLSWEDIIAQEISEPQSNGFRSYSKNITFQKESIPQRQNKGDEIMRNKQSHQNIESLQVHQNQYSYPSEQNIDKQRFEQMEIEEGQILDPQSNNGNQQNQNLKKQNNQNNQCNQIHQNIQFNIHQQNQQNQSQQQFQQINSFVKQKIANQQMKILIQEIVLENQENQHIQQKKIKQYDQNQIQNQSQSNIVQISSNHNIEVLETVNAQKNHQQPPSNDFHHEFSCQFPQVDDNNTIDCQLKYMDTDDQIRPSYQFSLIITKDQMTMNNIFDLKENQVFIQREVPRIGQILEIFDENNQFQDIFCPKSSQKSQKRTKQFEILKKYFVFSKQENSDQSNDQNLVIQPKRVKWVQDLLDLPRQKKSGSKKVKINQTQSQNQIIEEQVKQNIELLNEPRTRSQKMKWKKLLQQSKSYHQIPVIPPIKSKQLDRLSTKPNHYKPRQQQKEIIQHEESQSQEINILEQKSNEIPVINDQENVQNLNSFQEQQNLIQGSISSSEEHIINNIQSSDDQDDKQNIKIKQNVDQSQDNIKNSNTQKVLKQNLQHQENQNYNKPINTKNKSKRFANFSQNNFLKHPIENQQSSKILDNKELAQKSGSFLQKYDRKSHETNKLQNEETGKKIKVRTVHMIGRFHEEIVKRLSLIDEDFIEELTLYCDTMECALNQDSVQIISKMTKLTKLCVYWVYRLGKPLMRKLIENLSLLEELVLCEFHEIDTEIATQIVQKLPKLRRFHYASDYMKNLDKMEQNLQFLIDFLGSPTRLAHLAILSKLKNLQTFWISGVQDLKHSRQMMTSIKNLKEVSISAFQKKSKDWNPIMNALSKKSTLISLSLQSLQFKQQNLVSVIKNNLNLNTLIINQCPTVSNTTIAAIADNLTQLEQLFLMLTDSLQGERIFQLLKLKTLVVRACWSINVTKFKEGLKKLQKLKCLSLNMNNYWLKDDMLPSIAALPNLTFLNLDTTKVTDRGMLNLVNLKNLNTLICGRTEITINGLTKFLQKTKSKIRKLGLSRQSNEELNRPEKRNTHDVIYTQFQGQYLVRIGQLLPQLTHLSVGGFKNLYIENFATLDNLKCLQYKIQSLPVETEKFLQTTHLNLNGNY